MMNKTYRSIARTAAFTIAILAGACAFLPAFSQTSSSTEITGATPTPIHVGDKPPTPPNRGPWKPDAALMSKLGKPVDAADYTINPPDGYKQIERDSPDGSGRVFRWALPARTDGSQPVLDLVVANAPKGEEKTYSAGGILGAFIETIHQNHVHWSATTSETGTVNKIDFIRLYYAFVDDFKGVTNHGFVYVGEPSLGTFIIIRGEDAEPYADTDMVVLEDSALTLRPKHAAVPAGVPK